MSIHKLLAAAPDSTVQLSFRDSLKSTLAAALRAAWVASIVGAVAVATLLTIAKYVQESHYYASGGSGHVEDLRMLPMAVVGVLVLALILSVFITVPVSLVAATFAYPILRRRPAISRHAFGVCGFLVGLLVWLAIWTARPPDDPIWGSWLSVFVVGGLAGCAGGLAFGQQLAASTTRRRLLSNWFLVGLAIVVVVPCIAFPFGPMFFVMLALPLGSTHPPLIVERELESTGRNDAEMSRALTALLQGKYAPGTSAETLKSTLLDQGFKLDRLDPHRRNCLPLYAPTNDTSTCDTYDPDKTYHYSWGDIACGSNIVIWWTADERSSLVKVNASYRQMCI
jgi:hypothetical protein